MHEYGTSLSKGRRMGVVYFFLPPEPGREDGQEAWNPKLVVEACCILRNSYFSSILLCLKERVYGGDDGVWRTLCFMVPSLAFCKVFVWNGESIFLLSLKFWRKITYISIIVRIYIYVHVYSVQCLCLEACFAGEDGHGNQKHIDFCSSHDIRALGILWI